MTEPNMSLLTRVFVCVLQEEAPHCKPSEMMWKRMRNDSCAFADRKCLSTSALTGTVVSETHAHSLGGGGGNIQGLEFSDCITGQLTFKLSALASDCFAGRGNGHFACG